MVLNANDLDPINQRLERLENSLQVFLLNRFDGVESRIDIRVKQLELKIMASFVDVLNAIKDNGLLIISVSDAVIASGTKLEELITRLQQGEDVPSEELSETLSVLQAQRTQLGAIKDTVVQLVPSLPSPTIPSQPGEPVPDEPSLPEETSPDDVVISPNDDVGLPGSVEIDLS